MASDRRRRRRRRTRTTAGTRINDNLPDELLEQVLLRVRTPFCLIRAMATCKLWRRVIAGDDGFLHRVCSLHQPKHPVGHYLVNTDADVPEFVPFPARPAFHLRQRVSLLLPDGEHLSLDLLTDDEDNLSTPVLTDSRRGLLAIVHGSLFAAVICDPWTRQYRVLDLHEVPWDRHVECTGYIGKIWIHCLGAFILDASEDGDQKGWPMSSFRVPCVCLITDLFADTDTTTAAACVFSARDNGWTRLTVSSDVYTIVRNINDDVYKDMDQRFVGRAGGSIFLSAGIDAASASHVVLVIDEATGNFSTIRLPLMPDVHDSYVDRGNLRVVNGGPAGSLLCVVHLVKDNLKVLKVTRATHGGWECIVESCVDLCQLANIKSSCADRSWRLVETATAEAAATLVLGTFSRPSTMLFSLDVETMKLQWTTNKMARTLNAKRVFPYELPWPQTINESKPVV